MGWVKSMPGDVGEFSVNIGLGINFLAFGTLFVTLRDTLTYPSSVGNLNGTVFSQEVFFISNGNLKLGQVMKQRRSLLVESIVPP